MPITGTLVLLPLLLSGAPPRPASSPASFAPLIRAYRESSTPAGRAAIENYARVHARDSSGALARFALGIACFENKDFSSAVQFLTGLPVELPALGDYASLYLGSAQDALGDSAASIASLGALPDFLAIRSPLLAKGLILSARARVRTHTGNPADLSGAVEAVRTGVTSFAKPEGDFALALAYDALGQTAQAATYYQRVYFLSPATAMAQEASLAIERLKLTLGVDYPPAMPQLLLERGQRWIEAKEYAKARAELQVIVPMLGGIERDQARVRIGAAQFASGDVRGATQYLRALDLPRTEADAERWYYLEECARRTNDDGQMLDAIKYLARHHERSVWRLKALVSAGNRYLLTHQPDQYEPLYRAAWVTFPSDITTAYCHWKIAWDAYLANKRDALSLLREQVENYPSDNKAASALYYLGRLSENEDDYPAARVYYERLTAQFPNFYYAVLGRERLAASRVVAANPSAKVADWLAAVEFPAHADYSQQGPNQATRSRIERVRLLVSAGLSDLAEAEVRFGAKTDGQPHLLAVEIARTDAAPYLGLRHMKSLAPDYLSTGIPEAPKQFWKMLFPLPYSRSLIESARKQNLDPYMVAALIRQESEFNPEAHSHANAYGLTQIVPATGRMLARQQGIRRFSPNLLYQPETNLRLGTQYLRELLDQWNGRWEQTLASYNAGKSRAVEWMTWGSFREPSEFVESIPFTETREYVQAVIRNAALYRQIYGPTPALAAEESAAEESVVAAQPLVTSARGPVRSRKIAAHPVDRRRKPAPRHPSSARSQSRLKATHSKAASRAAKSKPKKIKRAAASN